MALDPHSQGQIQEFLTVLRRRRWQIFLPALFVLTLGSVFAVLVPKRFVLETEVEVREGPRMATAESPGPRGIMAIREKDNARNHIIHHKRVKGILDSQGELWDDYVKLDEREQEEYVRRLLKRIKVTPRRAGGKEGSEFVDISYEDVDGHRGEVFVAALVETWINMVVDRDEQMLMVEIDDLQDQVKDAQEEFGTVARNYTNLAKEMKVNPTQPLYDRRTRGGGDSLVDMRDRNVNRSTELEVEISMARAVLATAVAALQDTEKTISVPVTDEGADFVPEIADLENQIIKLEVERARIKPEHSKWKKIQVLIDSYRQQIEDLRTLRTEGSTRLVDEPNPVLGELTTAVHEETRKLVALQSEKTNIDARLPKLSGDVDTRIGNISELDRFREEKAMLFAAKKELERRLISKRSQLRTLRKTYIGQDQGPYEVVKAALAKDEPETPNPWFIVAFSLLAGLALGGSLALASEYARNSYRSVSDVAGVMAVPVLGAINTIVTTAEARRAQMRRALVGFSSAVICGGLAWFTWIWVYSPKRLPTELLQAIDDFRRLLM